MTTRERENATLDFAKPEMRGAVQETFFHWDRTTMRWKEEGLPAEIVDAYLNYWADRRAGMPLYLDTELSECTERLERFFGLDPIKRIFLNLPLSYRRRLRCEDDWQELRREVEADIPRVLSDEIIRTTLERCTEGHARGDYSVRIAIEGFFWIPRTLFGIEEHLYAFYDHPRIMHEINKFVLCAYLDRLDKILDLTPADVVYVLEDLSGVNGPMLSPALFDEFIGAYYAKLVPFLKKKGVRNVFVDTDGNFVKLIPNFMDVGVEGFLPMDVNAGVDIVQVRERFPQLKFIGGFNKLCIESGPGAIDREFERLMPVIRQGGYIPGCDHQVTPLTPLDNYLYYVGRLKDAMEECGSAIDTVPSAWYHLHMRNNV